MTQDTFKVIAIGGGPSGLIASHTLYLAGIDFIVLERREHVIEDLGASLVLAPPSLRVMHQLGILEKLLAIGKEIELTRSFDVGGRVLKNSTNIQLMREK